jgi:hypothetical protein
MKKEKFSMSFILIVQALLILLLFVSASYVKYATLALFCLFDVVVLFSLFNRKWKDAEWFTFTTFFCSLLFLMFYLLVPGILTYLIGLGIMLLFVISALLFYRNNCCASCDSEEYAEIEKPSYPVYHEDHKQKIYDLEELEQELDQEIFKDVEKKTGKLKKDYDRRVADALQYELEREALALEKAEKYVDKKNISAEQDELQKEAFALTRMQDQINELTKAARKAKDSKKERVLQTTGFSELQKEAKELQLAEKELEELDTLNKKYELIKEAGKLRKAEKQIEEVRSLNKQAELITEAQKIAQAQREFDIVASALKKNTKKITSKSFFVSKEGTKLYHKPNCKMIAKVPKNKLNLFTSKKDASKKKLTACKSCKP